MLASLPSCGKQSTALQTSRIQASCWSMEHLNPPDNLPVVPDENEPTEVIPFRDPRTSDKVADVPALVSRRQTDAPASCSLQPTNNDMTQIKERPIRAPDDLLSIDDVAGQLLVSRAAAYRLAARRRLPCYKLPGGLRFKLADVEAYVESCRRDANKALSYGHPPHQR